MILIPLQYHKRKFPSHITPQIDEIAAHFDIQKIEPRRHFSLHTEYSYGRRTFASPLLKHFPVICQCQDAGIPQLWHSERWSIEFADFLRMLCGDKTPRLIEIHPPYRDYCGDVRRFLHVYRIFEEKAAGSFPNARIMIENRYGSLYPGSGFLISTADDILQLAEWIHAKRLRLRIALDIPQILSACGNPCSMTSRELEASLDRLTPARDLIDSIHLWGKRRNRNGRLTAHAGDLDSYFQNPEKKALFLSWLAAFLSDGRPRFFVPEVNSSDADLHAILSDLEASGIRFSEG